MGMKTMTMTRNLLVGLLLALTLAPVASALPIGAQVNGDAGTVAVETPVTDVEGVADGKDVDLRAGGILSAGTSSTSSDTTEAGASEDASAAETRHGLADVDTEAAAQAAGAAGLAVLVAVVLSKLEALRGLKNGGALLLAPLYSRIGRSEILDNETRREIFDLVKTEPGLSMKDVSERIGCGWGTVVYHLERLEDTGFVASRKDQGNRRFFAVGSIGKEERAAVGMLRKRTPKRIAHYLLEEPGSNQSDLCEALGIAASTASKHLGRMEEADLVTREREWRSVHYYPSDVLQGQVGTPQAPAASGPSGVPAPA